MPFFIAPYPGQTYPSSYAHHDDIRAYLGFAKLVSRSFGDGRPYQTLEARKLPPEHYTAPIWVPLVGGGSALLYCVRGHRSLVGMRGKSSRHRCYAVCPTCADHVPAGRTHQHKCKSGAAEEPPLGSAQRRHPSSAGGGLHLQQGCSAPAGHTARPCAGARLGAARPL